MSDYPEQREKDAEKSKGGRPLAELTEEQITEVKALAAVLNTSQIADYFGISHVTFKAIRDRDERVSFAYKNGKAKAIASIAGNLISQAKSGNTSAQMFYLKTQAGWKETTHIETRDVTQEMEESELDHRLEELINKK